MRFTIFMTFETSGKGVGVSEASWALDVKHFMKCWCSFNAFRIVNARIWRIFEVFNGFLFADTKTEKHWIYLIFLRCVDPKSIEQHYRFMRFMALWARGKAWHSHTHKRSDLSISRWQSDIYVPAPRQSQMFFNGISCHRYSARHNVDPRAGTRHIYIYIYIYISYTIYIYIYI